MFRWTGKHLIIRIILLVALVIATTVAVQHLRPRHQIAMFDSGVPGTPEAAAALHFAHDNQIDQVINYSALNASPPERNSYLRLAESLDLGVVISLMDLLGPTDLDPTNALFHQHYGRYFLPEMPPGQSASTDQEVDGAVRLLCQDPAVSGFYTSDEKPKDPEGPDGLDKWLGPLQQRHQQVKALCGKPVHMALYWTTDAGRTDFMKQVKTGTDELMVDNYPVPENTGSRVGTIAGLEQVGAALKASAGTHGWLILQAFSWHVEQPTADSLGFKGPLPGPTADQLVEMARQGVDGGAFNLALFSYPYMLQTPGQEQAVKLALPRIRQLPGFG